MSLAKATVEDAVKEIKKTISNLMKQDKTLRVNIKVKTAANAATSDTKSTLFKAFRKSIREIKGVNAKIALLSGATDLRFLMPKKVPCLGYSARGGAKWHSDNEFVYIKSLIETSQVLSRTILHLK